MTSHQESVYRLVDFGDGRKLESIGGCLIDRPSPAALWSKPSSPVRWPSAVSRYDQSTKQWTHRGDWPPWVDCGDFRMPIKPTPYGHIGVFPEQADNWRWLANRLTDGSTQGEQVDAPERPAALNLFGYTGASTMAMVRAGFQVAHVDAAKPNVLAARQAAQLNDLAEAPIRYLVDDAAKFAAREVRRGRRYDTIVLDPPAYGHGPTGRAWRLQRDLWPLLEDSLRLVDPARFAMLVTGHSAEINEADVVAFFEDWNQDRPGGQDGLRIEAGRSQLKSESGAMLDAGFFVRVVSA